MERSNNIETDPAEQSGCFKAFVQIGGAIAILIIVLFVLKLLFRLN